MVVGNALIAAFLDITYILLDLFKWALIVSAIVSWLVAFGIINSYSRFVRTVGDTLARITEPALQPIRRVIPAINGIDLSPLVLFFIIIFLQRIVIHLEIYLGL